MGLDSFIGGLFRLLVLGVKNIVRDNKKTLFRPVWTQDKRCVSGDHSEGEESTSKGITQRIGGTELRCFFLYATQTFGLLTVPCR